jgi:DNA-binding IclR family transcriptional regulator
MPGLSLTAAQAARLWNVEQHTAHVVLRMLVDSGFLTRSRAGRYSVARWTTGDGGTSRRVRG